MAYRLLLRILVDSALLPSRSVVTVIVEPLALVVFVTLKADPSRLGLKTVIGA